MVDADEREKERSMSDLESDIDSVADIIEDDDDEEYDEDGFEDEVEALLAKSQLERSRPSSAAQNRPESARPGSSNSRTGTLRPESAVKRSGGDQGRPTTSSPRTEEEDKQGVEVQAERQVYDPLGPKAIEEVEEEEEDAEAIDEVLSSDGSVLKTERTSLNSPTKSETADEEDDYNQDQFDLEDMPGSPSAVPPSHAALHLSAHPSSPQSTPSAKPLETSHHKDSSSRGGMKPKRPQTAAPSHKRAIQERKTIQTKESDKGKDKETSMKAKKNKVVVAAPTLARKLSKLSKDFEKVQEQNKKLKRELKRIKRQKSPRPMTPPREEEDLAKPNRWTHKVPVQLKSVSKVREGSSRPASAGILYHGVMSETEQELWNLNVKTQMSRSALIKQELAVREALWDSRVTVSASDTGPSSLKALLEKKRQASRVAAKSRPKSAMGVFSRNSRTSLLRIYSNALGTASHSKATSSKKSKTHKANKTTTNLKKKKMKKKKGKKTQVRPDTAPEISSMSPRTRQLQEFEEQRDKAMATSQVHTSRTEESGDVPFDWGSTELYLRSAEKLRQVTEEHSQMEMLLAAIDNPNKLESSFHEGIALLQTLWEELHVEMADRKAFMEKFGGTVTTGNYAHVLSCVTRLKSLKSKLLHAFQLIKRRERLVDSLGKVLNPRPGKEDKPRSPKKVTAAAEEMVELRSLNEGLVSMIDEITQESYREFVLHGIPYLQKIQFDLVLP